MITAVFDGRCVICNTTRRIIRAMDWLKRVEFLDLHDRAQVEARFPFLDYDASMGEIHVIDRNEHVYAGFDATRRMLRAVPLGLPLWLLLSIPGVSNWLGPRMYRFIARHRYKINRLLGVDLEAAGADCETECEGGICKIPHAKGFNAETQRSRESDL
jgi:predicted DCC family thiol-disulfide oxidoreductase YuxK